jgi:hypothetical protein
VWLCVDFEPLLLQNSSDHALGWAVQMFCELDYKFGGTRFTWFDADEIRKLRMGIRDEIDGCVLTENVHVLEGLVCSSVSLRLAHLPPLQAGCGAHVAYAPRLRLRQAFSCSLWSQNSKS